MANKYIIEGAAFNGDGTSPDVATVNGGVGAWNTITYFEGATPAYGSLAAGDVVYIRSKTAAGADITRTWSTAVSYGSANSTVSDPIYWILDSGNVWPGVSGTLTYTTSGTSTLSIRRFNCIEAEVSGGWVFINTRADQANISFITFANNCTAKNITFDTSASTINGGSVMLGSGSTSGARTVLENPTFKVGARGSGGRGCCGVADYSQGVLIAPDIELLTVNTNVQVFWAGTSGSFLEVYGGRIHGVGATTDVPLMNIQSSCRGLAMYGTEFPYTMQTAANNSTTGQQVGRIEIIAADGGVGAAYVDCRTGEIDSRSDGYYPTLNAFLPTTEQKPWSWKVFANKVEPNCPIRVSCIKLITEESAIKTITCNFLVADSINGVNTQSTWLEVEYIDADTGVRKHISSKTRTQDLLEISSASWSATTYGAANLLKRQLRLTTPTAIKKDTVVIAVFKTFAKATSAIDLMFVCPDVVMS